MRQDGPDRRLFSAGFQDPVGPILYSGSMGFLRLASLVVVVALAGCTPQVAPTPTPRPVDFTQPGVAQDMLGQLMAAAGTTRVINVEFTAGEARLAVVAGSTVRTYAYRDGRIAPVDSDVEWVGQAIFDPRGFGLGDLGTLFAEAAAVTGSSQGQKLQIVEYDSGHIYLIVTTYPETRPVFFTPGGRLIGDFDATDPVQLAGALAEVTSLGWTVERLGIAADGSVYADLPASPGQVMHVVRNPRFPVRDQVIADPTPGPAFDARGVTAGVLTALLARAAAHTDRPLTDGFTVVVEQRTGDPAPTALITVGTRTVRATLDGVVLAG